MICLQKKNYLCNPMIDRATIDRIFSAADIAEVVGEFVQLKKKGANYTACCPFHNEKTPSFIVSPAKGLYKCFGCGKGGNAVSFVMEHEKLTYPEALKWIAKKYGIEVKEKELTPQEQAVNDDRESMMVLNSWAGDFFEKQLETQAGKTIAKEYFYERGFTDDTIKKFGLGYNPETGNSLTYTALKEGFKQEFLVRTGLGGERDDGSLYDKYYGRVIFPIHSLAGRILGFGGRTMRTDKKTAKYINSPESEVYHKSNTLYGIFFAKKAIVQNNKCILVEGYTDVMQMHQAGIENVVASSGTSLTVEQIKLIKRFTTNITVIYDGDAAGIKASMRGIDMILSEGMSVRVVPLPAQDDPDSFARKHTATQIEEYIQEHEEDFLSFKVRTLMGDQQSNDPIKRAEIISDIIKSIAAIPDAIQRSVYIRECSRTMDVDYAMLENEVRRRFSTFTDGQTGLNVVNNQIKKDRFIKSRGVENLPPDDLFMPGDLVDKRQTIVAQELSNLEAELIGYLVKFGEKKFDFARTPADVVELGVASTIIEELRADKIEFHSLLFKKIFDDYCMFYDKDEFPPAGWYINHEDTQVSSYVIDLITRDDIYKPSTIWERHQINVRTEGENLGVAIPKALTIFKSKVIADRVATLQIQLQGVEDMDKAREIMEELIRNNTIKVSLLERYQRLL